jgi:murein L,D-transpeptidase YafK
LYFILRYTYTMKLFCVLLSLSAIFLTSISFTYQTGPTPKKVYRDTFYKFKNKATRPATHPVMSKPVAAARPASAPRIAEVAEEDRQITINAAITHYTVRKSQQKLYVYFGDTFKVFRISLGTSPVGSKTRQGDNKTPEGTYRISFKNPKSRGYKSLRISYPNDNDRKNAQKLGVNPGGDICIHGLWWKTQNPKTHWKDNWTQGCIAVNNEQIDEIFQYAQVDTEITILP